MRIAMVQFTASDDPDDNAKRLGDHLIATGNCDVIVTPECSNLITLDKDVLTARVTDINDDATVSRARNIAKMRGTVIVLGSVLVRNDARGGFVNRTVVIDRNGEIIAQYDKIHMFDIDLGDQKYAESSRFAAGEQAVTFETDGVTFGLSICYDVRFPYLYRALAQAGVQVLLVPAAFTRPTGNAHWHVLMRARAIENGAYVIAPAQTGDHPQSSNKARQTYGHSLAVDPWGEVMADMGTDEGVFIVEIDIAKVDEVRAKIPSLSAGRKIKSLS